MTPTQQSIGIGALREAALGGAVGSFSGNAGLGTLLGAGVGAGCLYGQSQQSRQPYYTGNNNQYRDNRN